MMGSPQGAGTRVGCGPRVGPVARRAGGSRRAREESCAQRRPGGGRTERSSRWCWRWRSACRAPARTCSSRVTRPRAAICATTAGPTRRCCPAAPAGEPRTSRASRWIRETPRSSSPARTTTARRSRTVRATCGPGYYRSTNGGATWTQQPRAGLSRRRLGCRHGLADARQLRGGRGPDAGVRRRRAAVLRLHLLQPGQAHERLDLRRDVRPGRRPLRAHRARGPRDAVGVGALPGQDQCHRRPGLGQRIRALGAVSGPGRQQHAAFRALDRSRADVLEACTDHTWAVAKSSSPMRRSVRTGRSTSRTGRSRTRSRPQTRSGSSRSTDAGESFSAPQLVAGITPFDSTQFSGNGADTCGDGPFACPSGLTFARFSSMSAVAADATGVHVVYSAETAGRPGQDLRAQLARRAELAVRRRRRSTRAPTGHQFFPDITLGRRNDLRDLPGLARAIPAYSPEPPAGQHGCRRRTRATSSHAILARSTNGVSWTEQQLSTAGSNPNWEVRSSARSPFFGDYNYVSAVGSTVRAVWTDSRDLVPGSDPRETGADDDADGFDGFQTCSLGAQRHRRAGVQLADDRRRLPLPGRARPEHLRHRRAVVAPCRRPRAHGRVVPIIGPRLAKTSRSSLPTRSRTRRIAHRAAVDATARPLVLSSRRAGVSDAPRRTRARDNQDESEPPAHFVPASSSDCSRPRPAGQRARSSSKWGVTRTEGGMLALGSEGGAC